MALAENQSVDESAATDSPAAPAGRAISRRRLIAVNSIVGLTTVLLVVAVFAVWANRILFSPDNWSTTSTQLLQNANIRATVADYVVDQLYANVDVAALIKSALPPRLQPIAAPAAGALRNGAVQGVELALVRPRVQNLWAQANRAADQTFIAVVNGGTGAVAVKQGVVSLNLGLIVDNVAARLGLPPNLSAKLPANIAQLTVFKSNQLKLVQRGGKAIQGLALWLTILCPLLYALAIALAAGHRRRTLMTVGAAAVLAGVLVLLGRSILESQVTNSLTHDASLRSTITAVLSISTAMLSEIAGACIVVGIPLIVAGWFAGPAGAARAGRRSVAPFLREHPAESYAITLAVMALVFIWEPIPATGKPAGMIVFTLLALLGTDVLRRQTTREFPDARLGAATEKVRARVESMRARRRAGQTKTSTRATIPEQLKQLSDLRDDGTITLDEYQTAKTQLFARLK
jgi:hypothetical protein